MSYTSYRTNSAAMRGRGFSTRGSFRGRGSSSDGNTSWNTNSRGRGGFSGPSRGRFNWYKERSSNFDNHNRYNSGTSSGSNAAIGGSDRYSGRGTNGSYRRSYRGGVSDYNSHDHSHHRSPEHKRMRTDDSYVQASSARRSHDGCSGRGTEHNSRYNFSDNKEGYGEDRSHGYREDRRSTGSYRDHSREEYTHRKGEQLGSGMPPPSGGPPRRASSYRGSFRGRISTRGSRGISRIILAQRREAFLARKRNMMESYSIHKRIITSRSRPDILRRQKMKTWREPEFVARKEAKMRGDLLQDFSDVDDDDGNDDEDEDDDNVEDEIEEKEDSWSDEEKCMEDAVSNEEDENVDEDKPKKTDKKVKKSENEIKDKSGEEDEADEEGNKIEKDKDDQDEKSNKSELKDEDVQVAVQQNSRTLKCPVCFSRCPSPKAYAVHLSSAKHTVLMRKHCANKSYRLDILLFRMRTIQRRKQRVIENKETFRGMIPPRVRHCGLCKLSYKLMKTQPKHSMSRSHRAIKKLLRPFCPVCQIGFESPMRYESHKVSLDHVLREHNLKEMRRLRYREEDDMDETVKDVDMDNFMTLDSVGTIDGEGSSNEEKGESGKEEGSVEEGKGQTKLGSEFIHKVSILWCEPCQKYLPPIDDGELSIKHHCNLPYHVQCYMRYHENLLRKNENKNAGEKEKEVKETVEKSSDSVTEKECADETESTKNDMDVEETGALATNDESESPTKSESCPRGEKEQDAIANGVKEFGNERDPGNESSDEDEDSLAEGGRYDRFRYSEKGKIIDEPEGETASDMKTTKVEEDGDRGELLSPKVAQNIQENKGKNDAAGKLSPGKGTDNSTLDDAACD